MMCPICGGKDLQEMKDVKMGPDPYDYSKKSKEDRIRESTPAAPPPKATVDSSGGELNCPMCRFKVQKGWKFCPECGVKFSFK